MDATLDADEGLAVAPMAAWPAWPEYGLVDDLLPTLARWHRAGRRVALATLTDIDGSSPRPLGSEMAVADDGSVVGYVSGGCVEAEVAREALAALADGRVRNLDYGAGSPAIDIQLSCGGRIGIVVRPMMDLGGYVLAREQARARREICTVLTERKSGRTWVESGDVDPARGVFARPHVPPTRLVVVGGDPVTLGLAKLAPQFGLEVSLLRPVGPEHAPRDLALALYDRRRLDVALTDLPLDRWTAVYSLTHDGYSDLMVAAHALRSEAFCVGILGSRRKIALRLRALEQEGFDEAVLKRLHLPAGLIIGARSPVEIALSILAQVIGARDAVPQSRSA